MSILRVTGRVTRTDHRSGTSKTPDPQTGEFRPYAFDTIKVLVLDQDVVELTRFTDAQTPLPMVGEEVDYAVNGSARGGRMNLSVDKPWSELVPIGKH